VKTRGEKLRSLRRAFCGGSYPLLKLRRAPPEAINGNLPFPSSLSPILDLSRFFDQVVWVVKSRSLKYFIFVRVRLASHYGGVFSVFRTVSLIVSSPMENRRSRSLLSSVKATVGQLDSWDRDQAAQAIRRRAANSRFPGGFSDRQILTRFRLTPATLRCPSEAAVEPDFYCNFCDESGHSATECDNRFEEARVHEAAAEDPSRGIHRAIVHRLYLHACDLYRSLYPRFYPGPEERPSLPEDIYPVPLTGPDYLVLAIHQTASDLQGIPGFQACHARTPRRHPGTAAIAGLYYSKAFPISYTDFCCRVANKVEQDFEEDAQEDV
jgi:hypothetical protein